jgi:glycosyltransferase involved in cell wall biosynthesis
MHVAQFVQRYPPALGGSEAYAVRLCDYLAARGDEVSVWTTTAVGLEEMWFPANPERERRGGVVQAHPVAHAPGSPGVRRYPPLRFPGRRYILKAFSLIPLRRWQCLTTPCNPICPAMWRDAGRFDGPLDAVHATAFPYSFPITCGLRLARRRGVPFLLTPFLHLGDPLDPCDRTRRQYTAPHLRWLLGQADRVFVQTRAERDATVSLGVPAERVVLQGLGVEAREAASGPPGAWRAARSFAADDVLVGHLANNSAEKGTIDLLRAAERAWAAGHCFRVVLAGPEMPNFRAFWEAFGPKDRVSRLGVLSDEQKRDFFAGIDLFALPSRCDSFGLVLLEAWANGKPNLVYRAGGPAEVVRDGLDGLHAACGDVGELASQLGRLVADANLRRRLGECGRARVAAEFRWRDKLELVRETILACRVGTAHQKANTVGGAHPTKAPSLQP